MGAPLSLEQLQALCPDTPAEQLARFIEPLNAAFEEFGIENRAEFLAQFAHETRGFTALEERLDYSPQRLMVVWPARFPDMAIARAYAHAPQALANKVYANRMGNGDEVSGDGWRYRGRGLPHLTGRANYAATGEQLKLDLVGRPDQLLEPGPACRAGAAFWTQINGDTITDFERLTRRINGGTTGLAERYAYLGRAREALA